MFVIEADRLPFFLVVAVVLLLFLIFPAASLFPFPPKIIALCAIALCAVLLKKIRPLVRDWAVFIALIYFFDSLRGLTYAVVCGLQRPVFSLYVIKLERSLFGGIPAVWLQSHLLKSSSAGGFSWLEKSLTAIHGSHFVIFLLMGFLIWQYRRGSFPLYRKSFLLLIGSGIACYFAVPTVPPWMAANTLGILPPLNRFLADIYVMVIPDLSTGFAVNPVAAMPSLHAGFPALLLLLSCRIFGVRGLWLAPYTLLAFFTAVYAGEHYVVDIVAGIVLAALCFLVSMRWETRKARQSVAALAAGRRNREFLSWRSLRPQAMAAAVILAIGIGVGLAGAKWAGEREKVYKVDGDYVPRYADLLGHENEFGGNWHAQYYFGMHAFALGEYENAIGHFERAETIAETAVESAEAQTAESRAEEMLSYLPR